MSPVTSHSTIPPTRKARTCLQQHLPSGLCPMCAVPPPQESKDMPPQQVPSATCPSCTVPSTHQSWDTSPAPRAIGGTSHVCCPFLPLELDVSPRCTAWGHVPPRGAGTWFRDMVPGHVPLWMSHASLLAVATGTCPQCHTKCTSHVHGPLLPLERGRVLRETQHWGHVPCAQSHHPAVAGTFLHATCYWGHVVPME